MTLVEKVASERRTAEIVERLRCGCTTAYERHDGTCLEHEESIAERTGREYAEARALAAWNAPSPKIDRR